MFKLRNSTFPQNMQIDVTAYQRVHQGLGFFDASRTFGRLIASGKDALDLIHRMSTNDLKPLEGKPGTSTQTVLTNEKARVIDVLTILSRSHDSLITTSAGKEDVVVKWLDKFTIMEDAKFRILTESIDQYIVCGPRALDFFREYTDVDLISLSPMNWISVEIGGFPVTLQKSLRIAESGWQLFVDREIAEDVKRLLEARVLEAGGAVIDPQLFDLLRIEAGMPMTPNELNDKHNPLESTLVSAVSFTKGCYIGQEVIARLDSYDKVQRHMMGVIVEDMMAEAAGELESARSLGPLKIVTLSEPVTEIGDLTSVGVSPGMQKVIGLGYVRSAHSNPGARVGIRLNAQAVLPAELVKLPFDV